MAFPQDEQAEAVTNAAADAANKTAGSVGQPVGAGVVSSPTFVSATAKQLSATSEVDLYINITTAASLAIAIGNTSAASHVLNAAESDALGMIYIRVPIGWYVKLTGTVGDLAITAITRS